MSPISAPIAVACLRSTCGGKAKAIRGHIGISDPLFSCSMGVDFDASTRLDSIVNGLKV